MEAVTAMAEQHSRLFLEAPLRVAIEPRHRMPRGQYADSVMDSLESQNDEAIEGLSAKVKMIKDVQCINILRRCLIQLLVVRCHWDRSARFE